MLFTLHIALLDTWFNPAKWELKFGIPLYELLGIRWFKKYVPTTGDLARKRKNIKQIDLSLKDRVEALQQCDQLTQKYEGRHLLGVLFFIPIAIFIKDEYTLIDWIIVTLAFLIFNLYPILLQRYNRIRIVLIQMKLNT